MVRYDPNHKEIGKFLVGAQMQKLVTKAANAGKAYAISISPDAPPLGEGYITSFEVESGLVKTIARNPRACARLWNRAGHAAAVEWEHGHRILGRTVDFLNTWKP